MQRTLLVFPFAVLLNWAQVGAGSITGVVRDPAQAPIPGVALRVTNTQSGASVATLTDDSGAYRVTSLLPGSYKVEAAARQFETGVRENLVVSTGQVQAVDFVLQLGGQHLTVNVEASPDLAETQTSSVAQVVGHRYIDNLPLPNRSANSLLSLAPGVVMVDPGQGAENYPVFSVAGGRVRNQSFTLDGGNIGNAVGLTRPQQVASLPLDALEEFRIVTNSYSAEYGHSTGGIVSLSTRSGTNQFHGSVFEYLRNDALDARDFFSSRKPPLRLNQFGAALGGPIRRDRTHFFVSWEQTRQASSNAVLSTVPSLAQREGDFSALSTPISEAGTPWPGNRIPASRIDPVARAAGAFWPLPNRPGLANNYLANSSASLNRNIVVGKLDHSFNNNDRASARYYINDAFTGNGGSYGNPVADPLATSSDVRIQSVLGTWLHTFSPTLLNSFQVTFMQRKFIQTRAGAGEDYAGRIGLRGVSDAAFPTLNVSGYALLGSQAVPNNSIARIQSPIRDTQFQDSLSRFAGRHALKAGVEYRFASNQESNDISSSGNLLFNRLYAGESYASFLLGAANSASFNRTDVIVSRAAYWAAYLQDDIRVTDRLTINAGLRWEIETPRRVDGDKINGFDPLAINPVSGTPGIVTFPGGSAFDPRYRNFGPRLGLAYNSPWGLVIRAAGGVFFGPNVSNSIATSATLGFSDNVSYVTSQPETSYALQLSQGYPAYTRPAIQAPGFGAVAPGQRVTTAVQFFDRRRPSPVSYQYNFNLQKELARNLLLETGYIGNVSHHLTANDLTLNQVPTALFGPGNTQLLRPFPQFSNVTSVNPAIGNSTYHAGYVKVERRFASGFSLLAHYTFSKFLDDVASGDEYGDPGSYMDQYNRRLDKARSGSDVPHHLLITTLYELPRFGQAKLANALASGWQLAVYTNVQSGQPFTVYDAANSTNGFPAGTPRPSLAGDPFFASGRTLNHYFNTAAFVHPPAFQFGNAPRSVLRGPGSSNVDFSLARLVPLRERAKLEVRGEFFNVFNIANFDAPGHTLGNADFGIINSARPARIVEIVLRVIF